jgi:hypothetical protein
MARTKRLIMALWIYFKKRKGRTDAQTSKKSFRYWAFH